MLEDQVEQMNSNEDYDTEHTNKSCFACDRERVARACTAYTDFLIDPCHSRKHLADSLSDHCLHDNNKQGCALAAVQQ
jgi:hypothetical protein